MTHLKRRFDELWNKVAMLGLREGDDLSQFREVILLNKLIALMVILVIVYIPVEVAINGWKMIPAVLVMVTIELLVLVFNKLRMFRLAKYHVYLFTTGFVAVMGLLVGYEIHNYVIFIPIALIGTILFRTNTERIIVFLATLSIYYLQAYLFLRIPPQIDVPAEAKPLFAMVFFTMGMVVSFLSAYYFIRLNREFETIIVSQKEKLETRNKEVTDSITYARRIQAAILPSLELFRQQLPDSFIVYQPKDIVAGDFYWMEPVNDEVLFAAADCTGHGVPGAMVSVICYNALNRCVRENGLTDPAEILDHTTSLIIAEFEKSSEDVKDGMDISLCAWNRKTKVLRWAGANNPLWLVRNGELQEWKADKQPVGKHSNRKPFSQHSIQLQSNDMVYIFTDGYYDQFGGPKGKKYKASRLKELVVKIQHEAIAAQQAELTRTFTEWKGGLEQVDDVCVIGVRIL